MVPGQRPVDKGQHKRAGATGDSPDLLRKLRFARLILWWERAWRLAWPLPGLMVTFVALALFDLLPLLPAWLHAGLLVAFAAAGVAVLWPLRRLSWPDLSEAARRLERDSGLAHRPLQTLSDTLSAGVGDPVAQALWQAEHRRLRALLRRLSLKRPAPELARHDPWGLRFAPLLLLAIALSGGWHDAKARLARAVQPNIASLVGAAPVLQVWLTPPAYTGKAPFLVDGPPAGQPLVLPSETRLLALLQGGHGKAQIVTDDEVRPFQALDETSQRAEMTVTKSGRLLVRQGRRTIAAWTVSVPETLPPSIGFAAPPESDREGRLRLDIEGRDVYGIARAWAVIRRIDDPTAAGLSLDLPLGGAHPANVRQAAWHDLTGHPWAGLPVTIEPVAENVAGRRASGESVTAILPERPFANPIARAIVAQRRVLAATPDHRADATDALAAILSGPDAFGNDFTAYLALSTAVSRLVRDRSAKAIPSVLDILWQVALRIEEGDRPEAQRDLEEAERALEQALDKGASQAEIERLTNRLRTAMERYFDALAEQAQRQGMPLLPDVPDQPSISSGELEGMLDRLRSLSQTGSNDAARQLLSELRQMLDGLGAALQGGQSSQQAHQAQRILKDLQEITAQQRQLLDDTFRHAQEAKESGNPAERQHRSGSPDRPSAAGKDEAQRQEALRKRLGSLLQSLGDLGADIPDALGQAEQAMRQSSRALGQDDLQDAIDAQSEAVTRLQEGSRMAAQSMAQRMGPGMVRQGRGPGRDPLGRPLPGNGDGDDRSVTIPSQAEAQKARDVLDELRRRAGQAERPSFERDYLQRLLKQFF